MAAKKKTIPLAEPISMDDLEDILTPDQKQALLEKKQKQAAITQRRADYDDLEKREVIYCVKNLIALEQQLSEAKTDIYKRISAVIAERNQVFDTKTQQKKFEFTHDGLTLEIGYNEIEGWKESATVGIQKVEAFLASLVKDEETQVLVDTMNHMMKKTKKNQIRVGSLVSLEQLLDNDVLKKQKQFALFKDGVEILRKSWNPKRSCWAIRALERDAQKKQRVIATSLSSAKFKADFDFNGF